VGALPNPSKALSLIPHLNRGGYPPLVAERRNIMQQLDLIDYGHSFGHLEKPTMSKMLTELYEDIESDGDIEVLSKEINHHFRFVEVKFRDKDGFILKLRLDQE